MIYFIGSFDKLVAHIVDSLLTRVKMTLSVCFPDRIGFQRGGVAGGKFDGFIDKFFKTVGSGVGGTKKVSVKRS